MTGRAGRSALAEVRHRARAAGVVWLLLATAPHLAAQPPADSREVRQLVTFRVLPGQLPAVLELYRSELIPAYRDTEAMRHVRVFAEVESPEPLDLMVVTHYADMAAMDRANAALRRRTSDRRPVFEVYRQISSLTLGHSDQFVEVISTPNFADPTDETLEILESVRVSSGAHSAFERQILTAVHPWELEQTMRDIVLRSETARFLVADGWDYLRTYSMRNLAAWQAYTVARARSPVAFTTNRLVDARKTMVLREMPDLRVR